MKKVWVTVDDVRDMIERAKKAEPGMWISTLALQINEFMETHEPVLKLVPALVEKTPAQQVWDAYRDAFKARYEVDPVRNAKINTQVSHLVKRLGEEAVPVTRFYLTTNDNYYRVNYHDFGLLLSKAEVLRTAWKKGQTVTQRQARNDEAAHDAMAQLKRIEEGKI